MYLSRVLPVPLGDEVVELSLDDLPGDIEDYVQVLREERCSAPFWLKLAGECGARRRLHDCEIVLQNAISTLSSTPPPGANRMRSPQEIAEEIAPFHAMLSTLQLQKARSLPKIVLKDAKYQNLLANNVGIEAKDRWFQAATSHANAVVFSPPPVKSASTASRQQPVALRTSMLLGRGVYLTANGKTDEALKAFDTVLQRQSRNPVALLGKACCLLRKRAYAAALRMYQSVLSISIAQTSMAAKESAIVGPDGELVESQASKWLGPDPRVGIGLCLYGLGRFPEAQRAWTRAVTVNGKNSAAHLLLGLSKMNMAKQLSPIDATILEQKGSDEASTRAELYKEGIAHVQTSWKLDNKNAMAAIALAEHFCVRASSTSSTNKSQAQQEYERALKLAEHAIQYADSRIVIHQAWLTFARTAHLYSYLDETSTATVELRTMAQRYYSRVADDLGRSTAMSDSAALAPGHAISVLGLAQLQASRGEILGAINTTESIMTKSASVSSSCLEISLFAASLRAQSHPGATAAEILTDRKRARVILERTLRTIDACNKLVLGDEEDDCLDDGLRAVEQLTNPDEADSTATEAAELAIARTALARENLSVNAASEIARLGDDELNHVQMADILRDANSGTPEFVRAANSLLSALKCVRRRKQDVGQEELSTATTDLAERESLALRLRANLAAMLAIRGIDDVKVEETAMSLGIGQMQETLNLTAKASSSAGLDAEKTITLFNLGRALEALGSFEDAQKAYEAVLAAHPEYVDAKVRLALLTVCNPSAKGSREATQFGNTLLKEALSSDPSNMDTRSAYVCFLSGDLPASPNPPQWDGIKETIAQLFMGPSSSQAVQIFGSTTAARTVMDEARRDAFTLSALGWAYYNLGHNQSGPNAKKEKLRALLRCCDLLDKALTEDSRCAFALQGLAILSAEGTLNELTTPPNSGGVASHEAEAKRKRGAEDAISMLTKLREVTDDSSVDICTGHAYMVREDFERAFRSYELAARKTTASLTNGDAVNGQTPSSTKPSLLQYLARASFHLGMQTKSYPILKQSIDFFEQALAQLQQRSSSGAVAEANYVRYNIAVSRQKIMQMLFDMPLEERRLTVLQEAAQGVTSSQDTFKALLPEAQAGRLAGISAEIVEQRLLYSETSLQRTAAKNVEEQTAYDERVRAEREAIAERQRERQELLNKEMLEREEERQRRAEAIEEERKRAIEETRAWEYAVEEEKMASKKAERSRGGGGGKGRGKKQKKRKMDEGGSEIESEDDDRGPIGDSSDSDEGMIVDDEAELEQGQFSDEEILGKPEDSGDDDDQAHSQTNGGQSVQRKKNRLKRASDAGRKDRSSTSRSAGRKSSATSKGAKRSRKSRSRRAADSDEEDGDGNAANNDDDDEDDNDEDDEDRPAKKSKKSRMRRAKDEDLIESEEEV